ncbi:sensor kinase domain protein [Burkholderia pseudomallei MSHR4378]|nr:sensor kinase domain protein [Burkholderia pseudomallei MSHR4378]
MIPSECGARMRAAGGNDKRWMLSGGLKRRGVGAVAGEGAGDTMSDRLSERSRCLPISTNSRP